MNFTHTTFCIILAFIVPLIHAQQPYIRRAITLCETRNNATSELGYFCNGVNPSCQSYLTFRSRPPYNSVSTISALLGADPSELSQLNSVSIDSTLETEYVVLVPVTCSCSGQFYQKNISYAIQSSDTYFSIANYTLQGLSTCQAIDVANNNSARNLDVGSTLNVPLRCACPTQNQTVNGVNYLLSYSIAFGQFVYMISEMFGVDTGRTLAANGLSFEDPIIYPFTTLLVPLENPPVISQTRAPPPPPPPPPFTPSVPSNDNSSNTWVYVVVAVAVVLALIIGGGVLWFLRNKKKKAKPELPTFLSESFESVEKPLNKGWDENSEEFLSSISSIAQSLEVYKFGELKSATNNFSPDCLIEGSVYRGVINGDLAAIKRMNGDVSKEISLLSKINHFNLIRLSGVCFSDGHWYLVYEYAANGSLGDWIYNNATDLKLLTWTRRIQIALDVATGLDYLHSYASPPHVHKDIRSSNILVDSDMRAKIANFGLARSADEEEGHFALTRHIVGAKGYMAPEYLENGLVSPKLDVYSFGVLLLEMLTGKEVDRLYEGVKGSLSEILIPLLEEEGSNEKLISFMDPNMGGNYPTELSIMLIKLSERCLDEDLSLRPSMGEIVQSLSTTMSTTLLWESSLGVSGFKSLD
ncbi:transmembrane signal receptor [Lithospermum erythrorhizon]|uniref:Transmembrane signal receptor n=1 Tax=Lithospermum erythrorhizon TaxID=34254 RepID=A0AAV3QD35_LITER